MRYIIVKEIINCSNVDQAAVGAVSHTRLTHWNLIESGLNIESMRYRGEWYMTF